jgi:hypothetical protein
MENEWTAPEIVAATRGYLWMLRSSQAGNGPIKAKVIRALLVGPLSGRSKASIQFRFAHVSYQLESMQKEWLQGFFPSPSAGSKVAEVIRAVIHAYESGAKHDRRVSWLISALPKEVVTEAAKALAKGSAFEFPASTTYDAVLPDGTTLAPKAVIAHACLLHYGAPLLPEDFSGGEGTPGFRVLREAGIALCLKADPNSEEFRKAVKKARKSISSVPPKGCQTPARKEETSLAFSRDPSVVAFVENRAKGICELCGVPAPFCRPGGDPYLEVHHIHSLANGGPDTVENAAALCPNCHRECHCGASANERRLKLLSLFSASA